MKQANLFPPISFFNVQSLTGDVYMQRVPRCFASATAYSATTVFPIMVLLMCIEIETPQAEARDNSW